MPRKFKFGRRQPRVGYRRLNLGNYLLKSFPTPPPTADYTGPAAKPLADVYGNDISGDCTCAGLFHIKAVWLAGASRPIPFTATDVTNFYKTLSGWNGIEDDPSDTGLDCETVLNYAQTKGTPPDNDTIYGWVAIDGTDKLEMMAALHLFENLYFGINLPDAWVDPMPDADGFVWDVAGPGDPSNGHCIMSAKYDPNGVTIDSWGMRGLLTWPAVVKYAGTDPHGEVFTLLGADILDKASEKSPDGMNWTQLLSDFQNLGGK